MANTISIRRVEHNGWREIRNALKKKDMTKDKKEMLEKLTSSPTLPKRWQLVYKNEQTGDEISMIHFKGLLNYEDIWEVFAFDNEKLFTDTRRFSNKHEAENFVYKMLEGVGK